MSLKRLPARDPARDDGRRGRWRGAAPRPRAPAGLRSARSSRIVMNVGTGSSAAPARVSPKSNASYTPATSETLRFIHCTGAILAL